MKRLLIFAHYYIPDTASTGQILQDLAEGLSSTFRVTVICVVPSYLGIIEPQYKKHLFYREEMNGVQLLRIRVPEFDKTKTISRVRNILAYFFGAMIATFKVGKQDYVFSISQPPILGGLLGVWGKWMKRAKYIYNIQDFNPEQVMAVGYSHNKAVTGTMLALDKFSCRQSNLIITVGRDLGDTIRQRFARSKRVPQYTIINNWINERDIYPLPADHERVVAFRRRYGLDGKFVFMYSGNIGLYYDLEGLIAVIKDYRNARTSDGREVAFAFVGAGTMLDTLQAYAAEHQLANVVFIPYQDRCDLVYSLNAADAHWCLNAKGIKGVSCPSKFYGLAAAGKPVIGMLEEGSEIRCTIEESDCGLVASPKDYATLKQHINWFLAANTPTLTAMGQRGRTYLEQHLTKDLSVGKYGEAILKLSTNNMTQTAQILQIPMGGGSKHLEISNIQPHAVRRISIALGRKEMAA